MNDFQSLRCIAHTLNLAVKDITEKEVKIKDLLSKSHSIVAHFKRSSKASEIYKTNQNKLE
jgi:hypothetical protein